MGGTGRGVAAWLETWLERGLPCIGRLFSEYAKLKHKMCTSSSVTRSHSTILPGDSVPLTLRSCKFWLGVFDIHSSQPRLLIEQIKPLWLIRSGHFSDLRLWFLFVHVTGQCRCNTRWRRETTCLTSSVRPPSLLNDAEENNHSIYN